VSSALAPSSFYAFLEVGHFVLLFLAAGGVAVAVRRAPKQTERFFLGSVAVSVLLYTVYFAVSYGAATVLPSFDIGRETITGFGNVRFFNQYQTWTLPLLAGAVLHFRRVASRQSALFVLAGLWWTLVLASNVRGTVVAMAIAAVGIWLLFRDRSYRWLGVQVAALLLGGVFYYFLFTLGGGTAPQVVERLGEVGQSRRLQHWMKCLSMAWADPWLGAGPMHYAWPPNNFAPAAHPHNAFLQWLAEWGVPSTMIMGSLTVWGSWSWMREEMRSAQDATTEENGVRVALVAALLAAGAHAMVSGIIVMPVSQVLLVLIGGWAWGRYRHDGSSSSLKTSSFRARRRSAS
jgi:O-Antigen ligase.